MREPVVLQVGEVHAGQRLQHRFGLRTLDGDERVAGTRVHGDGIADAGDVRLNPAPVLLDVAGVDDEQEVLGRPPVDEDVVDDRALWRRQRRVLDLPDREPRGVVARQLLDGRQGIRAGDLDLAHVADVEQPDALAHREVLGRDAGVLDGHVPAAERHHARAQRDVRGVEGGFPERRSGSGRGNGVGHGGHARRRRGNLLTVLCGPRPVKAAPTLLLARRNRRRFTARQRRRAGAGRNRAARKPRYSGTSVAWTTGTGAASSGWSWVLTAASSGAGADSAFCAARSCGV